CVPGCESFERTGENAYALVMAARVGPVAARFTGRMTMTEIDPPHGYTLQFEGQGGAAGFARGNARVTLAQEGEQHTALTYVAKAQVGGKLAQVGSRLIDGVAAKMSDEFFSRFCARFTPPQPAVGDTATIPAPSAPAAADVKQENATLTPPGGSQWIRYAAIAALVIVLIVLYARGYRG